MTDKRLSDAINWVSKTHCPKAIDQIIPITGDASQRRYFRLKHPANSLVLMDAPPDKEDCRPFIEVTQRLRVAGLAAPEIIATNLEDGFLLLEDFGDILYRQALEQQGVKNADSLYQPIFATLEKLTSVNASGLPRYQDGLLQTELDLFADWYAPQHCQQPLSASEQQAWQKICELLIEQANAQPQVFVHRDFHSCNVLYRENLPPGIIDYQDAVQGPLTYDTISWLLDRYHSWPREQLCNWYESMRQRLAPATEAQQWLQWCDCMGLQRNLKILGIFARLAYRDGKHSYLDLMPRFYDYVLQTAGLYPQLQELVVIVQQRPAKQ